MYYHLSSSLKEMKSHYTAVVVGSGYGGGIAASRLARAGQSVCVLERGRERWPGEYPVTLGAASKEMQMNTEKGRIGSRLGMFEFHVNKEMNALVACGLGGTSLINANVALRLDPRVWDNECWPKEVIDDLKTRVEEGYKRAEEMLRPRAYPEDWPALPKLTAMEKAAKGLGKEKNFYRVPITVNFEDGENHVGIEQKKSTLSGDDAAGINDFSKNTTLMNYLPDAWNHGAEIFTQVKVKYLERRDGRWVVHFEWQGQDRAKFDAPALFVTADVVVLGAGTIGSTEILLRSKAHGLPLSDRVGQNFTGNGDVLGFAYNCDVEINATGYGDKEPGEIPPVGPCITSVIDLRDAENVEDGFVIEEGSIPGAISSLLPAGFAAAAGALGKDTDSGVLDAIREGGRVAESFIRGAYHGAVRNTQTYLIMAHDDDGGQVSLEDDRPRISWPNVGKAPVFARVNQALNDVTKPLGGTYVPNPIWSKAFHNSLITVHPLGGSRMAASAEGGVVNHKGQVFSGSRGNEVYEGLYVNDGSMLPCSLGVNPFFTISALAERNMALAAEDRGWRLSYDLPSRPTKTVYPPAMGIQFTETMKGYFSTEVKDDFKAAEAQAKTSDSRLEFTLTIVSDDLRHMLDDPQHPADIIGTVSCRALSVEALTVTHGTFGLFVKADQQEAGLRRMNYQMQMHSVEGKTYYFDGYKTVEKGKPKDIWPQTSTLYITVYEGDNPSGPVVGKGILHILAGDFAKQMTTMKVNDAPNKAAELKGLAEFGKFFTEVLYGQYIAH